MMHLYFSCSILDGKPVSKLQKAKTSILANVDWPDATAGKYMLRNLTYPNPIEKLAFNTLIRQTSLAFFSEMMHYSQLSLRKPKNENKWEAF